MSDAVRSDHIGQMRESQRPRCILDDKTNRRVVLAAVLVIAALGTLAILNLTHCLNWGLPCTASLGGMAIAGVVALVSWQIYKHCHHQDIPTLKSAPVKRPPVAAVLAEAIPVRQERDDQMDKFLRTFGLSLDQLPVVQRGSYAAEPKHMTAPIMRDICPRTRRTTIYFYIEMKDGNGGKPARLLECYQGKLAYIQINGRWQINSNDWVIDTIPIKIIGREYSADTIVPVDYDELSRLLTGTHDTQKIGKDWVPLPSPHVQ